MSILYQKTHDFLLLAENERSAEVERKQIVPFWNSFGVLLYESKIYENARMLWW